MYALYEFYVDSDPIKAYEYFRKAMAYKHPNATDERYYKIKAIIEEIENVGINVKSKTPQAIIVGYNPEFKLTDLNELANLQTNNYKLIIANKERNYPTEGNYIIPGAGPIVSAIETLLNKKTDIIIGKPNTEMLKIALSDFNIKPEEIYVVGDSYDSDIKMAQNFGAHGILITKEKRDDCLCITELKNLLEIMK